MQPLSKKDIRILDFDSSITSQKNLLAKYSRPPYSVRIVDMSDYGPLARMWVNGRDLPALHRRLEPADRNKITLYGSGDFHHISTLLTEQFNEDFCVVVFDFHPDLDNLPPRFSCGSWVNLIARQKAIKKIVMLGPSSEDLNFPHNLTFNFSYFKNGRVELYPFYHKPSITAFRRIVWDNLRDKDINRFTADIAKRLPSKNIYISVDKDCLKWEHAVTNWEPGVVSLDWLLEALRALRDNANIIGMDITGDYSPATASSGFKRFCINRDHPPQLAAKIDRDEVNRINESTNLKILELFLS
ncbi:MAG: arginase family protein [Candidatus Omnitrophica bacterium]|nr:arginase family protein [Candidatus Omnitrophota bacterium]